MRDEPAAVLPSDIVQLTQGELRDLLIDRSPTRAKILFEYECRVIDAFIERLKAAKGAL